MRELAELKEQLDDLGKRLDKLEAWAAENRVVIDKIDAYIAERKRMEADGK